MDSYKRLAETLMFTPVKLSGIGTRYGLEFRKNKTPMDLGKAITKAKKNGRAKIEYELSMLELYLKDVFKKIKQGEEELV